MQGVTRMTPLELRRNEFLYKLNSSYLETLNTLDDKEENERSIKLTGVNLRRLEQ